MEEFKPNFNFYDQTYFKSYNLDKNIQYQLNLLESLDAYTIKHFENVATITCKLCRKLHLSTGFTEYCTICAYLHDIGKLFIPSSVLQKPGKLTDEEYEIIKSHTTLGYKLCIKNTKLRPYYAGAYYHHECLDGTGYPQGLVKKDIPFEAQIIKVADEYDALVHKRQYKSHIGITDALKIIIDKTKPSPDAPENTGFTRAGKNNKRIVKKLLKVVIDDIEYEISCTIDYVKYLKNELKRFEKIEHYINKRNLAKNNNHMIYYEQYIDLLLNPNESIEEFDSLYKEFKDAYILRKNMLSDLHKEIKNVKRLRI